MKRKKILSLAALLLGASVLASCSGSSHLSFNANWYYDTTANLDVNLSEETLGYEVVYESANGLYAEHYTTTYGTGSYTTSLKTTEVEGEYVYEYSTNFTIDVSYLLRSTGESSETFTDEVQTLVRFKSVSGGLAPLYSYKKMVCHSPNGTEVKKLDHCYTYYNYTVETTYADGKGAATVTDFEGTYLNKKEGEEKAEKKDTFTASHEDYTYLDNEQLLFALRGMAASSTKASVYSAYTESKQTISIDANKAIGGEFTFSEDGGEAKKHNINYVPFSLTINSSTPGATQSVWVAETVAPTKNTYRNVILQIETPLSYGMGSLVYKLTSANFSK